MKKSQSHNSESGQAVVLLALGLIVLMGFAALAIDGGMIFFDRRQAQNAADTSALAGALAKINRQDWHAASMDRAKTNGYDDNQTTNWVTAYNPPQSGIYQGNSEYIQVIIRSRVNTSFVQLVFSGALENTVEAVARAKPGSVGPIFYGDAIVSLAPHGCKMFKYGGDAKTYVTGSGVFVNSDDPDCALFQSDNKPGILDVPDGGVNVVGGANRTVGVAPAGSIATGQSQLSIPYPPNPDIPIPTCNGPAQVSGNQMTEGTYSGAFPPSGVDTLLPGIYCIVGDFKVNGGDTLSGSEVLIYIDGKIDWNGGATINLSAPTSGTYKGLLIYVDPHNYPSCVVSGSCTVNDMTINGNSDSHFTGTFYAPASTISITGTGAVDGFNSQVIGNTIVLDGTADTYVHYDAGHNYEMQNPATIDVAQ